MTQEEMAPSAVSRAEPLRGLCGGSVQLPGDPAYDMARSPWNLQMRDYPAAVAYPPSRTRSPRCCAPRRPPDCRWRRRAPATAPRRWRAG